VGWMKANGMENFEIMPPFPFFSYARFFFDMAFRYMDLSCSVSCSTFVFGLGVEVKISWVNEACISANILAIDYAQGTQSLLNTKFAT
jgi:hypothetical protein